MKKFLKEKIFFLINQEEKEFIRQNVMNRDHKMLRSIICIIALLELIILAFSLISSEPNTNDAENISSLILYVGLIVVCLTSIVSLEILKKKGKIYSYFVVVAIFTFLVMLWGVGMSIVVSYSSFSLLYYVLTTIALSALICLEPWVEILATVVSTITYFVLYYTVDGIKRTDDIIFITGVLLVLLISIVCFYFNFQRRVEVIGLTLQISKLNEVLDDKANTDKLTGINNRLFLSEKLENEDEDFSSGGVMMFDLDLFKNVNDTYGHMAGDKCLSEIGRLIKEITKDKEGFSVRYGGEEFLIYIKNINKTDLFTLADTLRKNVENNNVQINDNITVKYTISIGLSMGNNKACFEDMINESDKALYEAKKTRNTVKFLN